MLGGGTGATGLARTAMEGFLGQFTRRAANYFPQTDGAALSQTHADTASQADTSGYLMQVNGSVLSFAPGHAVDVEGQQHLIHAVSITGHPNVTTADQTLSLQPNTRPLPTHRPPPSWPARSIWAYVTGNEDPGHQGRIQVEFEFEPLDPQPSGERVWLHTLTPYGGGQDAAHARLPATPHASRAHTYTGFLSLPEVGERVLVQFHAAWDNDAVVIGSVRQGALSPADSARDTKRWRTPSGNEVALTTEGEGASAKDVVSVHARNHVVLEAHVGQGSEDVFLLCGSSYVHLVNKGGQAHVEVTSAGSLLVHAAGHLQLEGDSVQILAKGGKVRVRDMVAGGIGVGISKKTLHKKVAGGKRTQKPAPNACFECALKFLWPHEGGYSNDPDDHGGATNFGVTHKDYDQYRQWKGLGPGDVRDITKVEATDLYHHKYWVGNHCDTMPPKLAVAHFDWSVLHGLAGATGTLQQALGVSEMKNPGTKNEYAFFGSKTKKALNEKLAQPNGEDTLTDAYFDERERWSKEDAAKHPSQRKYLHGWLNRSGDMRHYVSHLEKKCPGCQQTKK